MQVAGRGRAGARRSRAGALVAALSLLGGLLSQTQAAHAYPGAPWFEPDKPYTQNFADPHVLRVGDEFYAYATGTGGSYLPVMRSTDLRTWVPRSAYDPGDNLLERYPGFNDALPWVARWGVHESTNMHMSSWVAAPGVERFGDRYNAYYALWAAKGPDKHCISVATSASPIGPFTDATAHPLSCDGDSPGDIDPYPFRDPATGIPYLIWASEGPGGNPPTKLWSRELTPDGLAWAPGSSMRELTRTTQGWEGPMIENPAMVRYADRYFLLYSANNWWTDRYAIGYAECAGPVGPCSKPQDAPLLGNHGDKLGPGGPSLFFDTGGRLQMAYHHWTAPHVGYPTDANCDGGGECTSQGQRRMSVTELRLGGSGLQVGAAPPSPTVLPTDGACPGGQVPEDGASDVQEGSVHEAAVDCITWWGVTLITHGRYQPGGGVTRAQMASFLSRAVLSSGGSLPPPTNAFHDDDTSVHQEAIGRLAAAGLVQGTGGGRFSPDAPVNRAQMATFLVRALRYRTGAEAPGGRDWFADDSGSVHEASINSAATAGLAGGIGHGAYSPGATVRRDQMAAFLSRLLQSYVAAGAKTPASR